uniref:Nucleoside-diphosphate kinase n=1 Tax=Lotharella globosa TaxID=91324 RepID=A0A7S3YII0_9EUKA
MGCGASRPQTDGYVINGFYMSMREKFVAKGASIYYFIVEWDEKDLSWADFRGKILGPTDPTQAPEDSLRGQILAKYEEFGLKSKPNTGDNGVHASASPFEGLCERLNWAEVKLAEDPFGKALLDLKIDDKTIMAWTKDPQVEVDGSMTSLFDTMEDINSSECLAKAKAIAKVDGEVTAVKNMAFVFVKPHANNEAVQKLVKDKFAESKISITKEGKIDGSVIDKKLLIDNHYYSIANKAKLTKPKDLAVPESGKKKFEEKFGLTWEAAIKANMVMNAAEAAKKYNMDAESINARWAKAKDKGNLIKFGGGFYCAKVFEKPAGAPEKVMRPL